MPEHDPVAKISIIPRGQAGGLSLTFFAPSEQSLESGLYSRSCLENQMAVNHALHGKETRTFQLLNITTTNSLSVYPCQCWVAEEVTFGQENVTTAASNGFMQVSRVARQTVESFGFTQKNTKKIGQVAIGGPGGNPFLGQQVVQAWFDAVVL